MSETPAYLLAQTFRLSGTQTATVTDAGGTRSVDFMSGISAGSYFRIYLASLVGDGTTHATAYELLAVMEAALGSRWRVRLQSNGRVRITYVGTGTGELTFTAGTLYYRLGIFATGTGVLAPNAYLEGDRAPAHCILSLAFEDDTGWDRTPRRVAAVQMRSGRVDAISDRREVMVRKGRLRLHPKDPDERAASGSCATPAYSTEGVWGSQWANDAAISWEWSVLDTLATCVEQAIGCAFGNLQSLLVDPDDEGRYALCYFTPETLLNGGSFSPSAEGFDARWDIGGLGFSLERWTFRNEI